MSPNEGNFTCLCPLLGDKNYTTGDSRTGNVARLLHLVRQAALAPADKKTFDAIMDLDSSIKTEIVGPSDGQSDDEKGNADTKITVADLVKSLPDKTDDELAALLETEKRATALKAINQEIENRKGS